MSEEQVFRIGDDVRTNGNTRGLVVDRREMSGGLVVLGVMNSNGLVEYHVERAVRSAEGMSGYPMTLNF